MADSYIQGSLAFICTAAEASLLSEAWRHAADLLGDLVPDTASPEFLTAFPPINPEGSLSGFTALFCDPDFPELGSKIHIDDSDGCLVSIYGLTDFQPDPIAQLIRRCCPETLARAPFGFDWSYSCSRARRDNFGGGWCAIFPDRVEFRTTGDALRHALDTPDVATPGAHLNPWRDDPVHSLSDWKIEIANDDTRLGYLAWVTVQRVAACQDRPDETPSAPATTASE